MALQNYPVFFASGPNGSSCTLGLVYDDITPFLIHSVVANNNTGVPFHGELWDGTFAALLWSGNVVSDGQTANPPTSFAPGTYDVTPQNLHMVSKTVLGVTGLVAPYGFRCRWPA
jgi:hypothetical protein